MRLRNLIAFVFALVCIATANANQVPARNKIVLIPLDSRPAAGQFAQMIGAMNNTVVVVPPIEMLGRFTDPGKPDQILAWLQYFDFSDVSTLIVSTDMIAYGGLIASRVNDVDVQTGISRLARLIEIKKKAPEHLKMFAFAATMRLTPTATRANASFRANLAKFEEFKDRYERTQDKSLLPRMANLRKVVPAHEIQAYERTRRRNHEVQRGLLKMLIGTGIDYLIMGQDDAKPDGPQIQENAKLRALAHQYKVDHKVYFCEGIDQHSNLLVSRAIMEENNWKPKVRIVYSDPTGENQYALYESKTVKESLQDQIFTAGAEIATNADEYDYALYVNTPKRRDRMFNDFLDQMKSEIDQGFPVAVADINFGADGSSDEQLFNALIQGGRSHKLLAFAGWNTAGNTIGTAIPAANVYLAARRNNVNPLGREVAQREFLLHRMVDDWAYHKYSRPATYEMIHALQDQRDEVYGSNFNAVDQFAANDLRKYVQSIFLTQFQFRRFYAGDKEYQITQLSGLQIALPWPRAYEIRVDFKMSAEEL
ncbi:MAG TPA: DUF4127 family protein [Fimbriimonas sp.]|nr:DUF4127 family protein [Fimbriimonas sp.]